MILHSLLYTVLYVRQSTVHTCVDIWEKGRQSDDCAGIKEIHLGPSSSEEHLWLSLHCSEDCILLAPCPPTHIHLPAFSLLTPYPPLPFPAPSTSTATVATQILPLHHRAKETDKEKWREEEVGQTNWRSCSLRGGGGVRVRMRNK